MYVLPLLALSVMAGENNHIGIFPIDGAVQNGMADSFHIYLDNHISQSIGSMIPIIFLEIKFDTAFKNISVRNKPLKAATYGSFTHLGNNVLCIDFSIIDFYSNTVYNKIIPISEMNLNAAAATAALYMRSIFGGSPIARLAISSKPHFLEIYVDGKAEGLTPRELLLNPGLHQIEIRGYRIKKFSEIIHVTTGARKDIFYEAEVVYYPTWIFSLVAAACFWESILMYRIEVENRDKNVSRAESVRTSRAVFMSASVAGLIGSGLSYWKNRELRQKYGIK